MRPARIRRSRCDSNFEIRLNLAGETRMVKVALFIRMETIPGKEAQVEELPTDGLPLVREESATLAWFGLRLGHSKFDIFDDFASDAARRAHLSSRVAAALMTT
jgi:hypothetical protein